MKTHNDDPITDLLPGYALGALDEAEAAAVQAALQAQPAARRELDAYKTVVEQLAFSAPAQPAPDHLQADLKARLAATRPDTVAAPLSRPERVRRSYQIASAIAAVLIIAIGLLVALNTGGTLPPEQVFATLDRESTAVRYTINAGEVTDSVFGELVAEADGRRAVIAVGALPEIGPDQTFQLWVRSVDDSVRSGGLFNAGASDLTFVTVPLLPNESLATIRGVGVSLEPAGGSPYTNGPSGPRVFAIPINPDL